MEIGVGCYKVQGVESLGRKWVERMREEREATLREKRREEGY